MDFKNQKGATGADIIIAVTSIVISVALVSMIYANITVRTNDISRTAGATRVIMSYMEAIEKMSYTDFLAEWNNDFHWKRTQAEIPIWSMEKFGNPNYRAGFTGSFGLNRPEGYDIWMYAMPNYGSYSGDLDKDKQFDLVRDIRFNVRFSVGKEKKEMEFTTTKVREITEEVNPPDTAILFTQGIANDTKKVYLVKYSKAANAYIRTTENDSEWYSYMNKKWAMVIVSNQAENVLFDINGKLIASADKYAKYVWIPRFFTTGSGTEEKISEFAYLTSSTKAIKPNQTLKAVDNITVLYYNTMGSKAGTSTDTTYFVLSGNQKVSGKWILASSIASQAEGSLLNNSEYGPCELY